MINDPDYRLYLESKFEGLTTYFHAQFKSMHETLKTIKEQTTKTNGRVTELEDKLIQLDKDFTTHPVNCSSAQEVKDIKKDLEEYRLIKKYPKLFLLVLVFFITTIVIDYMQDKRRGNAEVDIKESIDNLDENINVSRGYRIDTVKDTIEIK